MQAPATRIENNSLTNMGQIDLEDESELSGASKKMRIM